MVSKDFILDVLPGWRWWCWWCFVCMMSVYKNISMAEQSGGCG